MTINRGKSDEEIARRYLQRVADREKNAKLPAKQEKEPKIILPAKDMQNPENYIILDGKTHGNYSYPDVLVAKEKTYLGKNWYDYHKELAKTGAGMLTIRQFADFLSLLKSGKAFDGKGKQIPSKELEQILNEIAEVRNPRRSEWLDADFKVYKNVLHINYEHFIDANGNITPKYSEQLEECLMEDRTPGIDMDDWLKTANRQGLPIKKTKKGSLHYWYPRSDNDSVARFWAGSGGAVFLCGGDPAFTYASLGVRAFFSRGSKG